MKPPLLVLASSSPRRRELLGLCGWNFTLQGVKIDETPRQGETPAAYVRRLAEEKVQSAASRDDGKSPSAQDAIFLAADTTVALGRTLLGKPVDAAEAAEMLSRLRGRTHRVFTAIAVLDGHRGNIAADLCVTQVPMRRYSDEEMNTYIATGDPLDKAGAYAIQHAFFRPVETLQGCHASVMGLPLCHLARTLKKLDVLPQVDIPAACQAHLNYPCPVFTAVLRGEEVG